MRGKRRPSAAARPGLPPDQVEQVRGVRGVDHAEPLGQPHPGGVPAENLMGDAVERSTAYAGRPARRRPGVREEQLAAGEHLAGSASGEGEQEDAIRRDALRHQPGDPRGERGGLARAGPGQHAQWGTLVRCSSPLLVVQAGEDVEHAFDRSRLRPVGGGGAASAAVRSPGSCPAPGSAGRPPASRVGVALVAVQARPVSPPPIGSGGPAAVRPAPGSARLGHRLAAPPLVLCSLAHVHPVAVGSIRRSGARARGPRVGRIIA